MVNHPVRICNELDSLKDRSSRGQLGQGLAGQASFGSGHSGSNEQRSFPHRDFRQNDWDRPAEGFGVQRMSSTATIRNGLNVLFMGMSVNIATDSTEKHTVACARDGSFAVSSAVGIGRRGAETPAICLKR